MAKKFLYLMMPLLLTGCIGSWIAGTGYSRSDYPDIRTVPERAEACTSHGQHPGDEAEARAAEFKKLEEDRAKIKARNEALRENAFPNSQKEEIESNE